MPELIRTTSADANSKTHFLSDPHQSKERERDNSTPQNTKDRHDDTDKAGMNTLRMKKKQQPLNLQEPIKVSGNNKVRRGAYMIINRLRNILNKDFDL